MRLILLLIMLVGCTPSADEPASDQWLDQWVRVSYRDNALAENYDLIGPFTAPFVVFDPRVRIIGMKNGQLVFDADSVIAQCDSMFIEFPMSELGLRKLELYSEELTMDRHIVLMYIDPADSLQHKRVVWAQ